MKMEKVLISLGLILLIMLAGCSSGSDLEVQVEKDIYFNQDKESAFAIKATDTDGPVEGLDINAEFAMTNMDHGTYEVTFTDAGEGIYTANVGLPMSGEWEIVFTIEQDGKEIEKVIQYEVSEANGVATVNGEWITNDDLEFYQFINDLHIAIGREKDQKNLKGEALKEAEAYWKSQEETLQDQNQLLTQIIRLRAMALLGEEKGHTATAEEVEAEINKVREQYGQFESAQKLIAEYGEDKFWDKEKQQYELIVLSQKVQNDLINQVKEENPDVNNQEIMYLAQKQYEELLVSQVNSLEIEIM